MRRNVGDPEDLSPRGRRGRARGELHQGLRRDRHAAGGQAAHQERAQVPRYMKASDRNLLKADKRTAIQKARAPVGLCRASRSGPFQLEPAQKAQSRGSRSRAYLHRRVRRRCFGSVERAAARGNGDSSSSSSSLLIISSSAPSVHMRPREKLAWRSHGSFAFSRQAHLLKKTQKLSELGEAHIFSEARVP